MTNSIFSLPEPFNEPILPYTQGSYEKRLIKKELNKQLNKIIEIPLIINGKNIKTSNIAQAICPHDHSHALATYHKAGEQETLLAIESAINAKKEWGKMSWQDRASIFLKAAQLISNKYRYILNASTMLNMSKNVFQAEIDATCEMADFFRFNAKYMEQIYSNQPISENGIWNRMEYRPLEGFVFAVTPFNFTSIAANIAAAPAMMGNTIVWKPSSNAVVAGYYIMELLKEAGLPDGVINFIPGDSSDISPLVLANENLGGIHFTGSTKVFKNIWKEVAANIENYRSYPRIVGETGGKDYIFMHNSADIEEVATAAIRGTFEYQGQKCSACSRIYVPASKWDILKKKLLKDIKQIKTGNVTDFQIFNNALIDEKSFDKAMEYIRIAKESDEAQIIFGGYGDKSIGYFVEPTLIVTQNPMFISMQEEIFGPVLTIYVYDDNELENTLEVLDKTSPYALTGAVFAKDRAAISDITEKLVNTAGNFYINDKPTGAVVGQQPFGGARASGTNDKTGSLFNLIRWTSQRTIKENFDPPTDFKYPFMEKPNLFVN
jgi:1-pyrroline-5-carboxylate dehydrogenase